MSPLSRYARLLADAVICGVLAILCGAAAGVLLPGIVSLLIPLTRQFSALNEALGRTMIIGGVSLAVLSTVLWLRGLSYMARPQFDRIGYLPLISSGDLSLDVRNNLSLNIYWYSHLYLAAVVGSVYPWMFLIVWSYTGNSGSDANATSNQSSSSLILIVAAALTIGIPFLSLRYIHREMAWWKVCQELYLLLDSQDDTTDSTSLAVRLRIADPLRDKRRWLARISQDLSYSAEILEARQARKIKPHPISTILRAVSIRMRQFLISQESLQESLPSSLLNTLSLTLVMLCQSKTPEVYQNLAKQVSAFDQDGGPTVGLETNVHNKAIALASRATAGLRGTASLVTALGAAILIIVIGILFFRHSIGLKGVLQYLPGNG